jgi:hypothetical protein
LFLEQHRLFVKCLLLRFIFHQSSSSWHAHTNGSLTLISVLPLLPFSSISLLVEINCSLSKTLCTLYNGKET